MIAMMSIILINIVGDSSTMNCSSPVDSEALRSLLNACCSLFEAPKDLLNSVTYCCEFLELDNKLEALIGDAISKCDNQCLDGYLDVDCENEEEEEEDEDDFDDDDDE